MKLFPLLLALWMQLPAVTPAPIIERVDVRGNKRVPSTTIKYQIQSKAGDPYNSARVARDVRAIYGAQEAFDNIWVEQEEGTQADGRIVLVFWVSEKPLIRHVDYKGLSSIQESDILKALSEKKATLNQGSPYDETKISRATLIIKGLLAEKGRQKAEVEASQQRVPPNSVLVTFTVIEGPKVKIDTIYFEGNNVFTDRAIKKAMKLVKESNWLTTFTGKDAYHEGKLAYDLNDVRTLYAERGYVRVNMSDPKITEKTVPLHRTLPFIRPVFPWGLPIPFWTKKADRIDIGVELEENNQYHVGDVKVFNASSRPVVPTNVLAGNLGLKLGDIYNETLLRDSFKNLSKLFGSRGYISFSATPRQDFDEEKKLVNLTVDIDEGMQYVTKRISIAGNTTTRDKVIRREIDLVEGGVFNSSLMDAARFRLNQLGYFESIKEEDTKVDPDPKDPLVNVTFKVHEKGRNTIGFSGGVSGIGGSFIGGNYETNNFLGFGETFTLNVQGGTRQSNVMLNFMEPYFMDRPLSLGFSVFRSNYRYDQARDLYGLDPRQLPEGLGFENRLNFQQSRKGFSVSGGYPILVWSKYARLGLTYQFDNSHTDAVNPATEYYFQSVKTSEQGTFASGTGGGFGVYRTRKLVPSFSYDTVDHPYYPTRGKSLSLTFEYTGGFLGGNTNYYRPSMEFRYFRPNMKQRNVIAMRFMAAHVRGFGGTAVPFYERFFPGGDYDIRGYEFRSLGSISFLTRSTDKLDPETGRTISQPFDDFVYVGGDTQSVFNIEYRIPVVGHLVTVAPFLDAGNAWSIRKDQLTRDIIDFDGVPTKETAKFLSGTNSGLRLSTGFEVGITLPVLNAPFRVIFAWNPLHLDRVYNGPNTGLAFAFKEQGRAVKFTVGKTF